MKSLNSYQGRMSSAYLDMIGYWFILKDPTTEPTSRMTNPTTKPRLKWQSLEILTIMGALSLTSCSGSMTKKECQETNYYELGLDDGKAGKAPDRLKKITEECQAFGIAPASAQYDYGHNIGLKEYCSASRGEDDAMAGKSTAMCSSPLFAVYAESYEKTLIQRHRDKTKQLRKIQRSQATDRKKNSSLTEELHEIEAQQSAR